MQCWSGDSGQTQVSMLRPDHYASKEEPVLFVLCPNVYQLANGTLQLAFFNHTWPGGLGVCYSHLLWLVR